MNQLRRLFLFLLLGYLSVSFMGYAQTDEAPARAPEPRTYSVEFFIPPQSGLLTDTTQLKQGHEVYVFDGKKEVKVHLRPGRRSRKKTLIGTGEIILYYRSERIDPVTGETSVERIPFARAVLPESFSGALVMISNARGKKGEKIGIPLRTDSLYIPSGAIRFLNTCPEARTIVVNQKTHTLRPMGTALIQAADLDESGILIFGVAYQNASTWDVVFEGKRRFSTESGNLFVVSPRGSKGKIRIFTFEGL